MRQYFEPVLRQAVAYAIACWLRDLDLADQERHRRWLQRMVGARLLQPEGQS